MQKLSKQQMRRLSVMALVLILAVLAIYIVFGVHIHHVYYEHHVKPTNQAEVPQVERDVNDSTMTIRIHPDENIEDVETEYTYTISDNVYPIWITNNGRCYVIRTSKDGNQHKQYISKDVCLQICAELGKEYVEEL